MTVTAEQMNSYAKSTLREKGEFEFKSPPKSGLDQIDLIERVIKALRRDKLITNSIKDEVCVSLRLQYILKQYRSNRFSIHLIRNTTWQYWIKKDIDTNCELKDVLPCPFP